MNDRFPAIETPVLDACMRCGMCLPTCPTYDHTGFERNSPRGRIAWVRDVAEGRRPVDLAFATELDDCLGCLACMSACPAGVQYNQLFEAGRAAAQASRVADSFNRRFWRWLTVETLFMHPRLLRLTGILLRLYQRSGLMAFLRRVRFFGLLTPQFKHLETMMPTVSPRFSDTLIRPVERPKGPAKYRVGLLTGCVQDLVFSQINRDTAEVLLAAGCEVHTPREQTCCGSLHAHNGEPDLAAQLARGLIRQFEALGLDAIITNAGGCGSHLRHFSHLLADDPKFAAKARWWDRTVCDIHDWLVRIGVPRPTRTARHQITVTYHASCHLAHGQGVRSQPLDVLAAIPGLNVVPLTESEWCCGSAGVYNITRPELATILQERKVANIAETHADVVATANPGCHIQLEHGLARAGRPTRVAHPITLLAEALRPATS